MMLTFLMGESKVRMFSIQHEVVSGAKISLKISPVMFSSFSMGMEARMGTAMVRRGTEAAHRGMLGAHRDTGKLEARMGKAVVGMKEYKGKGAVAVPSAMTRTRRWSEPGLEMVAAVLR